MENIKFFEKNGRSEQLVVFLHAYTSAPKKLNSCKQVIKSALPHADIYLPKLPASLLSLADPNIIVDTQIKLIDEIYKSNNSYKEIIIAGHSLGALLARKLYICACGENPDAPFEKEFSSKDYKTHRPWASKVTRIILFAGMNRGWQVTHHLSIKNAIIWSFGTVLGYLISFLTNRELLIFRIRKGATFITQLRIQWIHMRNRDLKSGLGQARTFQLLGSVDDMVSPEDNIDLISGKDFIYIDVPFSGHADVIEMDNERLVVDTSELVKPDEEFHETTIGEIRSAIFKLCLTGSEEQTDKYKVNPSDSQSIQIQEDVDHVVFVIHGIRDKGYWTNKIARRVVKLAENFDSVHKVATETSSYGYFPMLSFLRPIKRRQKVEWLMDQYAECLANYPNATFSFVGHSNGTYLLAKALEKYRSCKFDRIVFAGSVVRTNYEWDKYIETGQVKKVLNFVATNDLVVAVFPKAIQMLKLQDLGSAGHDGFKILSSKMDSIRNYISEVKFIKGAHGAALTEKNWNTIAHFVLTGELSALPIDLTEEKRTGASTFFGYISPIIFFGILALVVLGFIVIINLNMEIFPKITYSILYTFVIGWILTRL